MSYQDFEKKWLGKRVDTDEVPVGHVYQCVDLVKQYMHEERQLPYAAYGDAKQYWTATNPNILGKFDKIQTTDVRAGDIVPLRPVDNLASHAAGHVGIATGKQNDSSVEILEQNGSTGGGSGTGPDSIRKRFVPKTRVYGVLRPKVIPTPAPTVHPLAYMVGKEVFLPPTDSNWRAYAPGSISPREPVAILNPKKFGGLWYRVQATERALNSVLVTTQMFGQVSLPLASDSKGTLYPGVKTR